MKTAIYLCAKEAKGLDDQYKQINTYAVKTSLSRRNCQFYSDYKEQNIFNRPGLAELFNDARKGKVDTILVTRFDVLVDNLEDNIILNEALELCHVSVRSIN
jgi:DNA invertase Pin-like site-specific DNA recombinase